MNHSPAKILAVFLENQGVFPAGYSADWSLFVASIPDKPSKCGCVYDTTGVKDGRLMANGTNIIHYGAQLKIRSDDYEAGWQKMDEAVVAIAGAKMVTVAIDSSTYTIASITQASSPLFIGVEEGSRRRYMWTCNFLVTLN